MSPSRSSILFPFDSIQLPADENEMSRRYLIIMQRWIPFAMTYFNEWSVRPDCGHFFGGVFWYGQMTANVIKILALAATSPEYDAAMTGFSRDELRHAARKGLRYLCFTHDTGPADCVRPAKGMGRPEPENTKWGEKGQGFFRESQCGRTLHILNVTAALLREILDDETWEMLIDINLDYLERFENMPPRSGVFHDTQTEENAWTAEGISAGQLFLAQHPKATAWAEHAKKWMFCTSTMPRDHYNEGIFADGKTVSEWCNRTFTTLPDGFAENHAIAHPSYLACSVNFLGFIGNAFHLFGKKPPPQLFWHRSEIYDILSQLSDRTAIPHRLQGMDWPFFSLPTVCFLHASANLYLKNRTAAGLERVALDRLERVQKLYEGRIIDPEVAAICHGPQDPALMWERQIFDCADAYLAHRLMGAGQSPPSESEMHANIVRHFPHAGAVFHKHRSGQTSISWRNQTMILPLTTEGTMLIGPAFGTMLANLEVENRPRSTTPISLKVFEFSDRVAVLLIQDLAQDSIRQNVFFASLPDGNSLVIERLIARETVTLKSLRQGCLNIINERYAFAKSGGIALRTLYFPDGHKTFRGYPAKTQEQDVLCNLDHPAWVNIDDQLSLIFKGSGKTLYHNRHYFDVWRAVSDNLVLSALDSPQTIQQGDVAGELMTLICPNQPHTEANTRQWQHAVTESGVDCVIIGNILCCANLSHSPKKQGALFEIRDDNTFPLFPGTTQIEPGKMHYHLELDALEVKFIENIGVVYPVDMPADSACRIDVLTGGAAYILNTGKSGCIVDIQIGDQLQHLVLKP
ncbi:class II aldolase/adducin family protein [candidate division KSB1 bacterium]|nr:class II aldolase/adducin family protein [candidate division KSB1 bacterium]